MQFKHIVLVPVFVVMASAAVAAGADENTKINGLTLVDARCARADDLATLFLPPCDQPSDVQRAASVLKPLKADRNGTQARKLTKMPWQIGIFQ